MLKIFCEDYDFSSLAEAFGGEYVSDCDIAAEVIFCGEEEIRRLNSETRKIDSVTDVLSFPTLDNIKDKPLKKSDFPYDCDEEGNLFIGSIAICEKRAKEQAEEYGHSYLRELMYLITHGVCHLLGFDHMADNEKREMRAKEERVLKKLGLTRECE